MNTDLIVQKIISSPLFLRLKDVIKNNAWHDNESVYNHLVKTHSIAEEKISGEFITNPTAKKLFLDFINEDLSGVKRKDLMLITALVHDVGKVLYYKDADKEKPLKHETEGVTKMPGHEFWGSTIIPTLLKGTVLPNQSIERIAKIVRLHDTFNDNYMNNSLNLEEQIDDIKARAEGFYLEALFNIYCDVFTAGPSKMSIIKISGIFNQPSLYTKREYFVK